MACSSGDMNSGSNAGASVVTLSVASCPSERPLEASISRISTSEVSPKFLLESSSCSVVRAQIAQRVDAHLLQAVAAADGKARSR